MNSYERKKERKDANISHKYHFPQSRLKYFHQFWKLLADKLISVIKHSTTNNLFRNTFLINLIEL